MIKATGITVPALVSFIAFNMTTIPCFAAVAAARGEIPKGKFKWTLLFWFGTSYTIGSITYTILTNWWTVFIFVGLFVLLGFGIHFFNKRRDAKLVK